MQVNRRLYRCQHDRRIAGVAAGVAEYFDADPTIVRILWVLSIFFGGFGLLLYIAMAIIVPLEPETGYLAGAQPGDAIGVAGEAGETGQAGGQAGVPAPTGWHSAPTSHRHAPRGGSGRAATVFGIILILFGALALVDAFLPAWADGGRFLWPAFIVGIGALLVATAVRREPTES
jgi:phage shock protein PspC (stress-responsive transcriptional regulator)